MAIAVKQVGAILGSAALLAGATAAPALAGDAAPHGAGVPGPVAIEAEAAGAAAGTAVCANDYVEGVFSYSQDALTSAGQMRSVFAKAAATLCASMPEYAVAASGGAGGAGIVVRSDGAEQMATVEELQGDASATRIMGCACSSNGPGGGAIANAEASGASLEAVAVAAGAR